MKPDQELHCLDAMANKHKSLTREQIRRTLKQVYTKESKPVQVKSIKKRSTIALVLIYIGTIIVSLSIGVKFFTLEANLILPGLLLLITASIIGFTLTTTNVRKIKRSMSKFKDGDTPAYRTIFSESPWRTQAMVYAVLLCLMFIGIQNTNILTTITDQDFFNVAEDDNKIININENMVWLDDVILAETYSEGGQNYRYVFVEINNTINYYGKNLYLIVQSFYTGRVHDTVNVTFDEPDMDIKLISVKIHDIDDTSIKTSLRYHNHKGEHELDSILRLSVDEIYITEASGKVLSKTGFIYKSVEITAVIYNERNVWEPEAVTVMVTNPGILNPAVYKGSVKNNETLYKNEYWEVKIKFDINIIDQDSEFDVKLNINEKTKDEIRIVAHEI